MGTWDDPELALDGEFFSFNTLGDHIVGDILKITNKNDTMRGKKVADILIRIDADTEKTVTCGQYDLASQMLELRPEVGGRISIKFHKTEPSGKASPKKLFEIKYKAPGASAASTPAEPVVEAPVVDGFDDEPPF